MNKLDACVNIEDLYKLGKKKTPRVAFDYVEGGSEDCVTLDRNRAVYKTIQFLPRTLVDVTNINLKKKINGVESALPIICAPTGLTRLFHYRGELAVAEAAQDAGIPYTLSTVANTSLEDIAAVGEGSKFFQIYIWQNKDWVYQFIDRCKTSGYRSIYLAVDFPVLGKRERDLRNGHGTPRLAKNMALSALSKPGWLFRYLTSSTMVMGNMKELLPHGGNMKKVVDQVSEQFNKNVTWEDAQELQQHWGDGPFLLKGIQSVADAVKAAEIGATGIVLSNHGGRQLDGAPTSIDLLPEVKKAVGDKLEIIVDGGITRGSDIIKALCLGADACMVGRAYLYGLTAGGRAGVTRALDILKDEMERVMQLIGCTDVNDLNEDYIERVTPL